MLQAKKRLGRSRARARTEPTLCLDRSAVRPFHRAQSRQPLVGTQAMRKSCTRMQDSSGIYSTAIQRALVFLGKICVMRPGGHSLGIHN